MTSDAKLSIPTYELVSGCSPMGMGGPCSMEPATEVYDCATVEGDWCKADDVRGLVEGLRNTGAKLAIESMGGSARADRAEAQRDRLVALLRRTMTDTACVEVDGPGCWFCDRDDGKHADDCEAAQALADIDKEAT